MNIKERVLQLLKKHHATWFDYAEVAQRLDIYAGPASACLRNLSEQGEIDSKKNASGPTWFSYKWRKK